MKSDDTWKFRIEERVRWGDVDAARIIFYGAYIRFFEFAETELFRAVGLPYSVMFDELDIWLPRAHLECDFRRAAQLDYLLEVAVYVGRIGHKSLRLNFEVRRKGEAELLAEAHFVLVAVRRDTFDSVPVPDELKRRLAPYTQPSSAEGVDTSANRTSEETFLAHPE
ncbi:MAG: acyl-CoA thioesterase [Acidobacteria bacterium]|nr:acyl-CoA thioesterase [Acidobacteriota bacterium]